MNGNTSTLFSPLWRKCCGFFLFRGNSGGLFIIVKRMCQYTVELWIRTTRTAASPLTKEIRIQSKWQMQCSKFVGHLFGKLRVSGWETWTQVHWTLQSWAHQTPLFLNHSITWQSEKKVLFERLKHLYWCASSFRSTRLGSELIRSQPFHFMSSREDGNDKRYFIS